MIEVLYTYDYIQYLKKIHAAGLPVKEKIVMLIEQWPEDRDRIIRAWNFLISRGDI